MVGKIDSIIEDTTRKEDNAQVGSESNKSKPSRGKQLQDQYSIPVIINRVHVDMNYWEIK
jgi:hypothetical protein